MSFVLSDSQQQQVAAAISTVTTAMQQVEAAARRDPAGVGQWAPGIIAQGWNPPAWAGYPQTGSYGDAASYVDAVVAWCGTQVTSITSRLPKGTPGPDWDASRRGSGSGL